MVSAQNAKSPAFMAPRPVLTSFPTTMSPPTRRSRRGQPIVAESAQLDATSTFSTNESVLVRETDVDRDLRALQRQALEDRFGSKGLRGLETRFYASFTRGDEDNASIKREKKTYGKQKAAFEEFKVGETVLVKTMSKTTAVGVIVAILKVFAGEQERGSNVLVHWFSRPQELAKLRPHRDVLEVCGTRFERSMLAKSRVRCFQNEIYYQIDGTSLVSPHSILDHCTVLARPRTDWSPDEKTFVCVSAIYARTNLYYEFEWDLFRRNALAVLSSFSPFASEPSTSKVVENPWDRTDFWDVTPGETPGTPAKPKRKSKYAYMRTLDGDSDEEEEPIKLSAIAEADEQDEEPGSASKRKRLSSLEGLRAKRTKQGTAGEDALLVFTLDPRTPSKHKRRRRRPDVSSSDEGNTGGDFAPPVHDVSSEEDVSDGVPSDEDDASAPSDLSDTGAEAYPRTPRRKRQTHSVGLATPRRRGKGSSLAAPTPHSKAALRARANRKRTRTLAVRPPPGPGHIIPLEATGEDDVDFDGEEDVWLRAMQVLHVASRPEGSGDSGGRGRGMLPCREAEYGRILGAVEELLEEGSGGCVCA